MSLPPHLRQYVDPNMRCQIETTVAETRNYAENARVVGPKPQYDWRARNAQCAPINITNAPPAALCGKEAVKSEFVDRPKPKLTRTLGRDGKSLGIVGNVVHHPTGKQYIAHPASGREADNFLRRMTGHDPNRQVREACLAPTLMPDNSLGPTGEWGDTRQLPGFGVEQRGVDALNEMNVDRLGDGMLPFIRPDLYQWREKPVSYAKPTPPVREPLIPNSRTAGIHYEAEPIGRDLRYSDPIPIAPGTDGWKRRPESAEHMQLPREERRGSRVRSVISGSVPEIRGGPTARVDQTPFEDSAHNMRGSSGGGVGGAAAVPLMISAIKRIHKKLQQPHTLSHGTSLVHGDDDAMATAYDGVRIDVDVTSERAASRVQARAKETPVAFRRGYSGADGSSDDFDARMAAPGFAERITDGSGKAVQRDARAMRYLEAHRTQVDDLDGLKDSVDALGALQVTKRQDDKHLRTSRFDHETHVDEELAALADRNDALHSISAAQLDDRGRKATRDASVQVRSHATSHMATIDGSVEDIDTVRSQMPMIDSGADVRRQRRDRDPVKLAINGAQVALAGGDADDIDNPQATHASASYAGDAQLRSSAREHQRSSMQAAGAQRRLFDAVPVDDEQVQAAHDRVDYSSRTREATRRKESDRRNDEFVPTRFLDDDVDSAADRVRSETLAHRRQTSDASVHDNSRRGAFAFEESDAAHGFGDHLATAATRARLGKADAAVNATHSNTADDVEDVVTLDNRQQRVGTDQYRDTERGRLREGNAMNQRLDNADCDILTDTSFRASVSGHERTDRPVVRLQEREQRLAGSAKETRDFVADELDAHTATQIITAQPALHLSHKYERDDGRESRIDAQLKARMRSETPPPASHLHRNARFGRMLNASPSNSPNGSRSSSPVRF